MIIEAMKQALAFVEANHSGGPDAFELMNTLRTAIEAAEKQEPVAFITPLMEQQMFDDWCPYKGSPDPRTVWAAAVEAVNGLLLGATPPAAPAQEPVECMCGICKLGKREWVGLTDEVIDQASWDFSEYEGFQHGARWAQDQLREKNGGNK